VNPRALTKNPGIGFVINQNFNFSFLESEEKQNRNMKS
jgi:hypothetical protein